MQNLVYNQKEEFWYTQKKHKFWYIYQDPSVFWYAANKRMYFGLHRYNLVFVRLAVRLAMRACCWIVWFRLVSGCIYLLYTKIHSDLGIYQNLCFSCVYQKFFFLIIYQNLHGFSSYAKILFSFSKFENISNLYTKIIAF